MTISSAAGTNYKPTEKKDSTWDLIRKAQTQKTDSDEKPATVRVIHFPKERSIGRLMIGNEKSVHSPTPFGYPFERIRWEYFGHARGDVKVPLGKCIRLVLFSWTWQNHKNLSALKQLKPDDIYSLTVSPKWSSGGRSPSDGCMPCIAHLKGLKTLNLDGANITSRGLKFITELKLLERLKPPTGLDDSGMIHIGKLESLRVLYIYGNNAVTNKGLRKLSNLKSLELLVLSSVHMTDEGLEVLSDIPAIKNLILDGHFTNDAVSYLKDVDSLRTLTVGIGGMIRVDNRPILMQTFNDKGMQKISSLTQLENINVHWIEGITDRGVAHFKDMPSLKSLDIKHAKLTDSSMLDLKQIESLEYIDLPNYGITDTGIQHITELQNLRHLWAGGSSKSPLTDKSLFYIGELGNLEELSIGGTSFGDEGMKHIAKLTNLKQLSIFTANQLTNKGLAELANLVSLTRFNLGRRTNVSISGLKSLNSLGNLKSLRVRGIQRDDSVLDISGLTGLEDIILSLHRQRESGQIISDSFKNEDWACLANLTKLKRLQITGVGIDDEGVRHLSGLTNLEFLNIICPGESRITDEAFKYLVGMDRLSRLIIGGGHFTDKALDYLDDLPLLTRLELTSDYAFSNQAIREFQRKNPDIMRLQLMP